MLETYLIHLLTVICIRYVSSFCLGGGVRGGGEKGTGLCTYSVCKLVYKINFISDGNVVICVLAPRIIIIKSLFSCFGLMMGKCCQLFWSGCFTCI